MYVYVVTKEALRSITRTFSRADYYKRDSGTLEW